ncbi:MAG: translation elongation factor 4 [bacterium]
MSKETVRNFAILSHIDHGKSTLADRFLEITKTVSKEKMRPQYLDMMELEREKGITIKMQPVRMVHNNLILNLIDTPGHVDFSYEVSRSLAAVEGAILLVDATKGIQAQTLANLELARKQKILIIPAVNKIDLPQAKVGETREEMASLLGIHQEEIFLISAKNGDGVEELLNKVASVLPVPVGDQEKPLRALIFDSKYDAYKGVIAYVKIIDGRAKAGDKIFLIAAKESGEIREVGFFKPEMSPESCLEGGEIGYIATGMKEPGKVRVGDTITVPESGVLPLEGYKEPKPMVFLSIYPEETSDYDFLKEALDKLRLTDPALTYEPEFKEALGRGFRCGFLGSLHAEIISERLKREFDLSLIMSTPSVVYKIINTKDQELSVKSAADWPEPGMIKEMQEPWARLEIMTPKEYLGRVMELVSMTRSVYVETKYFGSATFLLVYEVPLIEIIVGFYDRLKGATQGYASLNYEFLEFRKANLVKMEILIAGKKEEAFSKIVPESDASKEGKNFVFKLKEALPPQLFSVPLQAMVSGKVIARETIRAKGKDVIAPLYGGDYTRKRKLLERQKKGKKELKEKGRVIIPPKVFFEVIKK